MQCSPSLQGTTRWEPCSHRCCTDTAEKSPTSKGFCRVSRQAEAQGGKLTCPGLPSTSSSLICFVPCCPSLDLYHVFRCNSIAPGWECFFAASRNGLAGNQQEGGGEAVPSWVCKGLLTTLGCKKAPTSLLSYPRV